MPSGIVYRQLDIFKFVLAIVVVIIHCGLQQVSTNVYNIFQMAVPYFFAMSGFLMYEKLQNLGEAYLNKYTIRILKLYCLWTLIYLPITIYTFISWEVSLAGGIYSFLKNFILVGENYMSWALWFLLALLVACLLLKLFMFKLKANFYLVLAISLLLALIGFLLEVFRDSGLGNLYFSVFFTTRNGFFHGFSYLMMGMLVARLQNRNILKMISWFLLPFLLIASSFLSMQTSWLVNHALCFVVTYSLVHCCMRKNEGLTLLRKLSIWIYLSHLWILFILIQMNVTSMAAQMILTPLIAFGVGCLLFRKQNPVIEKIIAP